MIESSFKYINTSTSAHIVEFVTNFLLILFFFLTAVTRFHSLFIIGGA